MAQHAECEKYRSNKKLCHVSCRGIRRLSFEADRARIGLAVAEPPKSRADPAERAAPTA